MAQRDRTALLIVDVQRDFCPGGALAASTGDRVIAPLNRLINRLAAENRPVYASRDWHPAQTRHFAAQGGPWPPHCVQGSEGAAFHADLQLPASTVIVTKGDDPEDHGYSAFEGKTNTGRPLAGDLRRRGIDRLYVGGIATDYCVRASVLDALREGLKVTVLTDAIAGVDISAGDSERALQEMVDAGAELGTTESSMATAAT